MKAALYEIAHARAGDKGNTANVSVIPYKEAAYRILLDQVTPQRVANLLAHRRTGAVKRYEVPGLPALNFVIEDALEGGVNQSLGLDGHGKSLSFLILSLEVDVPVELLGRD